jgi:murein DD-endopeptidase MepM/ murein hydrolase activator NlpD
MGLAGDDPVADPRTRRRSQAGRAATDRTQVRLGGGDADVIPLRRGRESVAQRLEREREEQSRAEKERRSRIEHERAERDRVLQERLERRRLERLERLRRERADRKRRERYVWSRHKRAAAPSERGRRVAPGRGRTAAPERGQAVAAKRGREAPAPEPARARIEPGVKGPVKRRARAAENRRRESSRRRGLFWPTAKAGFAVTLVLGLSAGLGSVLGLPVPGLDAGTGRQSLASSAAIFGIDAGTPPGLAPGYVFPLIGAHNFGDSQARFGASRYGHVHEGQDIFGKVGTPEVAVHDGVVVDRGKASGRYSGGRGNYVAVFDPADNHSFVYMHMLRPPVVQTGDRVHAGQVLGRLGCTGSCDGPHLHFEVRIGKATLRSETKPVDPLPYLRGWPQSTPG